MGLFASKNKVGKDGVVAKHKAKVTLIDKRTHAEQYDRFEDWFNRYKDAFPDRPAALEHYHRYHK